MPENKNLKPTEFPMKIRFGEEPKTEFYNNVERIKVVIKEAPDMDALRNYLYDFATATWEDNAVHSYDVEDAEKDKLFLMILKGLVLPSALETIKVTFLLEGISYQDVTHILRYRNATFSAECSGDKWWSHKNVLVPSSIENSPEFYERFKQLHLDAKKLYCDMLDSKEISLLDARLVLTRAMETYYWVSMDLGTALGFIRHRIDKQIQPETDNVIAYKLLIALTEMYPLVAEVIDIHAPAKFYVETARTGRCTNLFIPDEDSDIYEWNKEDYLYQRKREEVNGTHEQFAKSYIPFKEVLEETSDLLEDVRAMNRVEYGEEFFK